MGKVLDGDLPAIILFTYQYEFLQGEPFGWKAISEGVRYGGVNRYFVHWYISGFYKTIPSFLQNFVNPIDSIFIAAGISKTAIHLSLLSILAMMIVGAKKLWNKEVLIAMLILVPLFQSGGHFYRYFGIVSQSFTYSSFYALPLFLLLLYLKPFYDCLQKKKNEVHWVFKILLIPFLVILPFSGPLVPGVVLVIGFLAFIKIFEDYFKGKLILIFDRIPGYLLVSYACLSVLCLYSIYLGQFNVESGEGGISIFERYSRLPLGLYYQLSQKMVFPLLFLMLFINLFLIRKYDINYSKINTIFKWIGLFSILYLLLLPLGGFREYRPNIIRKDTFLPIIIGLVYLYGYSTYLILKSKKLKHWKVYFSLVLAFSFVFTYADEPDFEGYECQRNQIQTISESSEPVLKISDDCNVLSWYPIEKPEHSELQSELFQLWNIRKESIEFYQEKQ